jgi:ribonuclease-3
MVSKEKKIFYYDIYEDNGIDPLWSEIKYRRVNCKSQSYLKKESRRKASQRTYFALQEKMDKK